MGERKWFGRGLEWLEKPMSKALLLPVLLGLGIAILLRIASGCRG